MRDMILITNFFVAPFHYRNSGESSATSVLPLQKEMLLLQKQKLELKIQNLAIEKNNLNMQSILLQHKLNKLAAENATLDNMPQ